MNISTKLATLLSIIFILVGLVPAYFYYTAGVAHLEASSTGQVEKLATSTMGWIDQMFYERYLDIRMLANDPVLTSGHSTPKQITGRLMAYKFGYPAYSSLSFFHMDRIRIADTDGTGIGKRHSFTEFWPGIAAGKQFVTVLSYSESLNAPTLHFAAIVRNEQGKPIGVVVSRIKSESFGNILAEQMKAYKDISLSSLELVNANGFLLYSSLGMANMFNIKSHEWAGVKAKLDTGLSAGVIDKSVDGEFLVFAREPGYRQFKGNNWVLIAELPQDAVFAPAREFMRKAKYILAGIIILAFPLIFWFSHTFTSRIRRLRDAAADIGRGKLGTRIEISSSDELCELAESFNQMALKLKERTEELQLAANVFTHAREGITITDINGTIIDVNEAFTRITGYSRKEAIGSNPRILKSGQQDPEFYKSMWKELTEHGHWSGEIWNRHKNGGVYAEMITISAVRDEAGKTTNYVGIFTDITPIKENQQQLEYIAHYDVLTSLPNRVLLADRLKQAMIQSHRRNRSLAVLYLDLDGFKWVNDNHGHAAGDELLITVSQRMKAALRDGDTLARIGGDEFMAVLPDLEHPENCEPILLRLLEAAAVPVSINDTVLQISVSIGVTFYPYDAADADHLIRNADQAMYQAKQEHKNCYKFFDSNNSPSQ